MKIPYARPVTCRHWKHDELENYAVKLNGMVKSYASLRNSYV